MNIRELKELLDEYESKWNPEMEEYFGKFEDQKVCTVYLKQIDKHAFTGNGIGEADRKNIKPDWEHGLVLYPEVEYG